MAVGKEKLRKMLLHQKFITFCLERELGLMETPEQKPVEAAANVGLTDMEKQALRHLVDFWNLYLELPGYDADDMRVIRDAVHTIQSIMAVRVAKRVDPDFWR